MPRQLQVRPGNTILVAFHNGDDFPVPDRPPRLENILDTSIHSRKGILAMRSLRVETKFLFGEVDLHDRGTSIVAARTRPNLIELEPAQFESYLRHEGLDHVIRWRKVNN